MGLSLGCRASLVPSASEHSQITFVSLAVSSIGYQLETGQLNFYLELSLGYRMGSSCTNKIFSNNEVTAWGVGLSLGCRANLIPSASEHSRINLNSLSTYENNCKYKKNIVTRTQSTTAKKTLAYQKQNYPLTIEQLQSMISDVNNSQRKIYSHGQSVIESTQKPGLQRHLHTRSHIFLNKTKWKYYN